MRHARSTGMALMTVCLLLAACESAQPVYSGPSAFETGHWTKVQANPPTYFPKGMPKDHLTWFEDGLWVEAGDPADSRFFVPLRGYGNYTRPQLEAEAKAAIHPDKPKRKEEEEPEGSFWGHLRGLWPG